jgi:UDP-N-acetylmuramoylalanine--D-glutamate ligase
MIILINQKLNDFKQSIKGKKVAVIGIGVSNTPLIKYLIKLDVKITAFDKKTPEQLDETYTELKNLGVNFSLGEKYLTNLAGFDIIYKTPGIRHDLPEIILAQSNGAVLTSEMEVFFDLCPAQIIAVTGSDGKTTTTTLIHKILTQEGYKCWLGGNIGTPLLDKIDEIQPDDKIVLELSSFQLQTMSKSANIAVITNIAPNHLDIHSSMDEYIQAKKNIYAFQSSKETLIVNYDNQITREIGESHSGRVIYFSRKKDIEGIIIRHNKIIVNFDNKPIEIMDSNDILIPGVHNQENYLAAIAAIYNMVKPESIAAVAKTFKGVAYRNELVRELNQVRFYNDSIASSPTRTRATLYSYDQKVILIAGGYDKHIPYDIIGVPIQEKVKGLVLMGKTGPRIKEAYLEACKLHNTEPNIPIFEVSSMKEAVETAYKNSQPGDIITLSPASASFDMFRNFEEKGNYYNQIVNQLV